MEPLFAWKFRLGDEWVAHPSEPSLTFRRAMAVVIAPTEAAARVAAVTYARERGHDYRWLDCVPQAKRIDIDTAGATLCGGQQ